MDSVQINLIHVSGRIHPQSTRTLTITHVRSVLIFFRYGDQIKLKYAVTSRDQIYILIREFLPTKHPHGNLLPTYKDQICSLTIIIL